MGGSCPTAIIGVQIKRGRVISEDVSESAIESKNNRIVQGNRGAGKTIRDQGLEPRTR